MNVEKLTAIIKAKVPRLTTREIEGLAKAIQDGQNDQDHKADFTAFCDDWFKLDKFLTPETAFLAGRGVKK